jgi:hypothetical protein
VVEVVGATVVVVLRAVDGAEVAGAVVEPVLAVAAVVDPPHPARAMHPPTAMHPTTAAATHRGRRHTGT